MRISTSWAQQLGVNSMLARQASLSKTQMQLSTGLKVLTPADDPAAAVRALDLQETIDKTHQYQDNIFTARARLNIEESVLAGSEDVLFRAKELTIQAANATLSGNDRLAIKQEVDQLLDELAGLANTKNANGEFIFSGDLSSVPPFAYDSGSQSYVYQGGINQRVLQIGPERQVADGDLGLNVFENIDSAASPDGKRSIFNTLKALSNSLGGDFQAASGAITGDRFLRYGLDYSAAPTSFDLSSDAGGPVTVSLSGNYASLDEVVGAINATAGLAAAGITARSNGNNIEFVSSTQGAASSITINAGTGGFLTDAGFAEGQTGTGADLPATNVLNEQLNNVLTDLDSALDSFLRARTSVGARLNALDDQELHNEKFILDTQTTLSETQDLDYAEAISRFNLQTVSLQAAQQAYAKVQQLSLFNYL